MHIKVDHDTGQSCFEAVCDFLNGIDVGQHAIIHRMTMGDRVIHAEVVKALIHASREDVGRNYRTSLEPSGDGWSVVMVVTCTGYA